MPGRVGAPQAELHWDLQVSLLRVNVSTDWPTQDQSSQQVLTLPSAVAWPHPRSLCPSLPPRPPSLSWTPHEGRDGRSLLTKGSRGSTCLAGGTPGNRRRVSRGCLGRWGWQTLPEPPAAARTVSCSRVAACGPQSAFSKFTRFYAKAVEGEPVCLGPRLGRAAFLPVPSPHGDRLSRPAGRAALQGTRGGGRRRGPARDAEGNGELPRTPRSLAAATDAKWSHVAPGRVGRPQGRPCTALPFPWSGTACEAAAYAEDVALEAPAYLPRLSLWVTFLMAPGALRLRHAAGSGLGRSHAGPWQQGQLAPVP